MDVTRYVRESDTPLNTPFQPSSSKISSEMCTVQPPVNGSTVRSLSPGDTCVNSSRLQAPAPSGTRAHPPPTGPSRHSGPPGTHRHVWPHAFPLSQW